MGRTFCTPGFLACIERQPVDALAISTRLLVAAPGEPTWIVGDPDVANDVPDDGGATIRVPAPFKFYAIRDDHPPGCDCGWGAGSVVTFLLHTEYQGVVR